MVVVVNGNAIHPIKPVSGKVSALATILRHPNSHI